MRTTDDLHFDLEEWCENHFGEVRPRWDGSCMVRCPAHDDENPSLHVSLGDDEDRIVFKDFAGCSTENILAEMDLGWEDLWIGDPPCRPGYPERRVLELADEEADFRDALYRELMAHLTLALEDRKGLRRRGLTDERIDRNGYRTLTPGTATHAVRELTATISLSVASRLPGITRFTWQHPKHGPIPETRPAINDGLLIPVRDGRGRIIAFQVRREGPGPKYVWFSRASSPSGAHIHVPLATPLGGEVRVTEGPLKADVVAALDPSVPCLGIPGVSAWRKVLPLLERCGVRTVRIAFDADWQTKKGVAAALLQFGHNLHQEGYRVVFEVWNLASGKGLDDLLLNGGKPCPFSPDWGRSNPTGRTNRTATTRANERNR